MNNLLKYCLLTYLLLVFLSVRAQREQEPTECLQIEEQLYLNAIVNGKSSTDHFLDSLRNCGQDDPQTLMHVAKYLFKARDYAEAKKVLVTIEEATDEKNQLLLGEAAYYQGVIAQQQGLYEAGMAAYKKSLSMGYNPTLINCNMGEMLTWRGREQEALEFYERAIEAGPSYYRSFFLLGQYYEESNQFYTAAKYYMIADSLSGWEKLECGESLASAYYRDTQYDRAYAVAERVHSKFPDSFQAIYLLGYTSGDAGHSDRAREVIEYLKSRGLETDEDYYRVAYVYESMGLGDSAAVYHTACLKLDSESINSLTGLASIYRHKGEFEQALSYLDEAFKMDSNDYSAIGSMIYIRMWQHEYEKTWYWLNRKYELYPDGYHEYFMRGYILLLLERYEEAIDYFEGFIEHVSDVDDRVWNNLGACYTGIGEYMKAADCFDKALGLDPENSFTYHNRGWMHAKTGSYDEACADLATSIDLEYNWVINSALVGLRNSHCPGVALDRKINVYSYKGNAKSRQDRPFIDVIDSLATKEMKYQSDILSQKPEVQEEKVSDIVDTEFSIYPNPTEGIFTVRYNSPLPAETIRVFNQSGTLLESMTYQKPMKQLDLSGLEPGVYVIMLTTSSEVRASQKLVIL